MNNYEIILEALQYQVDNGDLTLEEAEMINETAYNRYIVEGANIDLIKIYNDDLRDLRSSLKQAKKLARAKEYDKAIKAFQVVVKLSDDVKSDIKNTKDTAIEKVIGTLCLYAKDFISILLSLGTLSLGTISFLSMKKGLDVKKPKRPIKPDTFFNRKFDRELGEWKLDDKGIKKLNKYTEDMLKYEKELEGYNSILKKAFLTPRGIITGVLFGAGIILSIKSAIDKILVMVKTVEGSKKLLEKDMDKEHWDRMVTKTYNPLRAYVYQLCDDISTIAERSIKALEKKKNRKEELEKVTESEISFFYNNLDLMFESVEEYNEFVEASDFYSYEIL